MKPMKPFTFPAEQSCPHCHGRFTQAMRRSEFEPVVVVVCPQCSQLLWRPGIDDTSRLFPFDPDADAGGI